MKRKGATILACLAGLAAAAASAHAAQEPGFDPLRLARDAGKPENVRGALDLVVGLTVLSLAPALLVLVTSFTRIVIVLSFVRRAIGAPELPPNPVLTGLALLLTFMVMAPTFGAVKRDALDPYTQPAPERRISQEEAFRRASGHLRAFMFQHVRVRDLGLFMDLSRQPRRERGWTPDDVPTEVLIPAFVTSELRRAFVMGFAILLPFLVIDLVVSAVLVALGMFVLPPAVVSLPFKVLLFILVDGWNLVVGSLVKSFHG
ncbi:MAG TPA: flagellar type III secretion system pore protein FliP [Planctomycetota bacterium]|nr:flagellar type III secretion system pore protein FliP [Planctomycetota bacterium]